MPPATFDFGGKVVLVTGVGRAGQIGNAVALAFGTAGAKIVACDVNAVGVSERHRVADLAGAADSDNQHHLAAEIEHHEGQWSPQSLENDARRPGHRPDCTR